MERVQTKEGINVFYYARYADDIVFGIPLVLDKKTVIFLIKNALYQRGKKLKLEFSYKELDRASTKGPGRLRVLGLRLSILEKGNINMGIPYERWTKKMTLARVEHCLRKAGLPINLHNVLTERVRAYFFYTIQAEKKGSIL